MKRLNNIRVYAWLEFAIWLLVIAIAIAAVRFNHYRHINRYKSYQIFMNDVDGLIVGSPVKFLGTQIGHVTKMQLVSSQTNSDIYVKFIITEKNLNLPTGVVATVEGSGLGGSKSLEIYLPDENSENDKIIASKDSTRLNKVMSLFNEIFKDIEQIFSTVGHAANELSIPYNSPVESVDIPEEIDKGLTKIDTKLDSVIEINKKFHSKINSYKSPEKILENNQE